MRSQAALFHLLPHLAIAALALAAGCSSNDNGAPATDAGSPPAVDSGGTGADATTATPDAETPPPADAQPNADAPSAEDAGAPPTPPTFLVQLDSTQGQLTEGLWEVSPSAVEGIGTTGTPITGYAPLAQLVAAQADGGAASFGALASGAAQSTYTLGITTDAAGNVYVGLAAAAAPPNNPAPGIYKLPAGGGTATAFSVGSAVTPAMGFPNGLDFIGADLFVADSEGVIYKIDASGTATVWSQDPLLAPDKTACNGAVGLAIGANGIVHDATNVYVTNTNFGRFLSIPIGADGSAGAPVLLKEDCATLAGADGIVIDPKDSSFIVALNAQNKIVRLTPAGTVTVLASGAPLATPASVLIDSANGARRLLITNSAFFTPADAGAPGLLAMPLP